MFAEPRWSGSPPAQGSTCPSLKALLAAPFDNALIVEAGNLRPDSGLRKLFETHRSRRGASVLRRRANRCRADRRRARPRPASASIGETRAYLMTRLGADQALSRSEVTKLALYAARQRAQVTPEDIEAIVGDAAETALETFRLRGERRRPEGGAARAAAPRRRRHRSRQSALIGARPALHAVAPRRCGASRRRKRRAGGQVASAAPAFQARARSSSPIAAASGAARLAHALPLDPGGDQALAPLARARGRLGRAAGAA